jgi:TRAP-type uncharacterized transport system substrate-binding protein
VIRFGAQNPGHPWWNVAEIVTEALVGFSDPLLRGERVSLVTPRDLQGALYNPVEVATGELDVAITTPSVTARMAREGTGPYERAHGNLRALAAYPHLDPIVFMVDADTGLTSLEQLVEQRYPLRLVTGRRGPDGVEDILTFTVGEVLRRYGASYADVESWGGTVIYGGPTHIGGYRMLSGEANALFQEAAVAPVFGEIARSRPVNVLPVADHVLDFMRDTYGFARNTVPAGHHSGAKVDTPTLDFSGWLLFCRDDLPFEQAYAFARACDETREKAGAVEKIRFAVDCPIDAGYLFEETAIPLHDGARAYAEEKGYLGS